jgi:hypothetical protein
VAIQQDEHRRELLRRLDAITAQGARWRDGFRPDQIAWSPGADAWSIGQVFEHLVAANHDYLLALEPLVNGSKPGDQTDGAWKPTVMGNLLVRSLASPRKLPAPKEWRPAPSARPAVIEAFLDTIGRTTKLVEQSAGLPWQRLRFGSPSLRLIRLNLGDGFTVIAAHAERHFQQVERIGRAGGFPR